MQDHLSREEAIIAFSACEHNQHAASNNYNQQHNNSSSSGSRAPRNQLEEQQQQHLSHGLPCIKLERDTLDATERWQSSNSAGNEPMLNSTRLLLQGSDDPLISHGASNDAHDEDQDYAFKCLLARKTEEQLQTSVQQNGACSTLTKQQLKANLMNGRKHQLQQQQQLRPLASSEPTISSTSSRQSKTKRRSNASGAIKLRFHHQALPAEYAAHYEATQGRQVAAPRVTAPAVPPAVAAKTAPAPQNHENVRSWLRKIAEIQRSAERQQQAQESGREVKPSRPVTVAPATTTTQPEPLAGDAAPSSKRAAIKYADLPYMGEITLDNYKPRRGRKPKKADICHLIYKNYGTIIPPSSGHETKPPAAPQIAMPPQRVVPLASAAIPSSLPEEPLNLCMRDQSSDRYSISSSESDKPSTVTTTTPTTECGSCSHRTTPLTEDQLVMRPIPLVEEEKPHIAAKVLLHPMGVYYQQLMETCRLGLPVETIEKDNQLALKIPIPSGFFASSTVPKREPLLEQPLQDAGAAASTLTQKRKRSAIFIPPMPSDHSSSPSTEVSICKFKFTGGAKPTLQEKKMLSVDAEGNYRYYNGTGDRTMRGYEFISREQQQLLQQQQQQQQQLPQQQQQQPNHDKLYIDIPPPSTDLSLELLHIPSESPTSSLLMSNSLVPVVAPQSPSSYFNSASPMRLSTPHPEECHKKLEPALELLPAPVAIASPQPASTSKRRSSRRARQREKLEKTFKEKGFLIQTQQLQSAEGATYCKFRQLKKFTRYLFRNWKDHIPESDLAKHQSARDSSDGTIETMLAGQIGLGVENLGTN